MVGDPFLGWVNRIRLKPTGNYVILRKRVRMVSFVTLRTFEMVLAVSLICLDSKRMSKDSLVESLTIDLNRNCLEIESTGLEWSPALREYASDNKKVEHLPIKENALCTLPFLKGLPVHTANIEHLFNNPKLRNFLVPIMGLVRIS